MSRRGTVDRIGDAVSDSMAFFVPEPFADPADRRAQTVKFGMGS